MIDSGKIKVHAGRCYPVGAYVRLNGVRFSIVARHATRIWLALFNRVEDTEPAMEIEITADDYRLGDVWSVLVEGVGPGVLYMYRMDGPHEPEKGHRYDPSRYLLDPRAKMIVGRVPEGTAKCMVVCEDQETNIHRRRPIPMNESIVYEVHVRGFTMDPSSAVSYPGTYRGLVEKIPYLKELGVTAVELLPVQEIGEERIGRRVPQTGEELYNYWEKYINIK